MMKSVGLSLLFITLFGVGLGIGYTWPDTKEERECFEVYLGQAVEPVTVELVQLCGREMKVAPVRGGEVL